ncbi:MAG: hypothetical protein PVJ64_15230 [Gemmatimonadales bacterium]
MLPRTDLAAGLEEEVQVLWWDSPVPAGGEQLATSVPESGVEGLSRGAPARKLSVDISAGAR